ncbi:Uncharacterized protein APZ42_018166 [Daphnia magna]|uniref:Uncharacterized protein n=1 Tax=Daphnia magna TaxID=35525 RepID=A0A164ZB35_9CRUS|nr:Uncharacterized protein APZ42_018166 [Daphnia magna]
MNWKKSLKILTVSYKVNLVTVLVQQRAMLMFWKTKITKKQRKFLFVLKQITYPNNEDFYKDTVYCRG